MTIHAKKIYSQICCIALRVLQTSKEFWVFPSIILADLLGNTCLLVIGVFSSTLFVSVFQGSLLWTTLFRTIIDQFSWKIFQIFLIVVFCKKKAMSTSCPRQKIPLIIANSFAILEQSSVILNFAFTGQAGRARCIVICINPTHAQMIDGTDNRFEVCKRAGRYNEFGCNVRWLNSVLSVIEYISFAKSWQEKGCG